MGRVATSQEADNPADFSIPATLGDPDGDKQRKPIHLDLIGDDEDDELDTDAIIEGMQTQLDAMTKSQSDEREFLQNTILSLSSRNAAPAAQQQEQEQIGVDFTDLPDPVEKKDEFQAELSTRINKALRETAVAATTTAQAQTQQATSLQDLQSRFTTQHPEMAKKPSLFTATVTTEVNKLKAKGLDAQQFVFGDPDKFLKTVANSMMEELGIDEEDLDDDEDEEQGRKPKRIQSASKRNGLSRARGVKGGSGARRGQKRKRNEKPLGFIDELKKQQLEMGII